jgi:protein-tyrosine phosphatase
MKILMVCLGNICRSPLADGMLRNKVQKEGLNIQVDSAGTSNHHSGQHPDTRMTQVAKSRGIDLSFLVARQFTSNDFEEFDIIYVMDDSNYQNVIQLASNENQTKKVRMLLSEINNQNNSVPDPYFGGEQGFIDVFNLVDKATDSIIKKLKTNRLA